MSETKVRVRLDTKQAKSELQGLVREAKTAAGKVSSGVTSAVSRGFGMIGVGAGVGAGMAALKGATQSGFGDVVGEAFGGIGAQISEFLFGDLDDDARASRSAREEMIQSFRMQAGVIDGTPRGAKEFYDGVKSIRLMEEKGRGVLNRDEAFRGPGIDKFISRLMAGIAAELSKAVNALADRLFGWIPFIGGR